ncbi:hypothetical protein [Streptomyces manipurensis]|uniref:hypothetical protein n=1 Tax=Streptomyces manipurensis TaxID=1077945 RepID=UPI003C6FC3F4
MLDPELLERITARRAELDELEEQLATQLARVRAERDELATAERVLERITGQLAEERASAGPMPGQVRPSWNRCAASWSDSSIAAGCANSPTAASSTAACDQEHRHSERHRRGVTGWPPEPVGIV